MLPGTDQSQPFSLRLEIVAHEGHPPASPVSCLLGQRGGTIGRAEENDLVLPDPGGIVSRLHAQIDFTDGDYLLLDRSTNGTFAKGGEQRLEPGVAYRLRDGETLAVGSYVLAVGLLPTADAPATADGPESGERLIDLGVPVEKPEVLDPEEEALPPLPEMDGWSSEARRPDWFPSGPEESAEIEPEPGGAPPEPRPTPVLDQHLRPSVGRESASPASGQEGQVASTVPTGYVPFGDQFADFPSVLLPDDEPVEGPGLPASSPPSDETADRPTVPPGALEAGDPKGPQAPVENAPRERPEAHSAAPDSSGQQVIDSFLEGLNLPGLRPDPERAPDFMQQMGRLVHVAAQGLIDSLRLRAEFKHEFYVPATSIAPVANNLFKYSVNASDALSRLTSASGNTAYLDAAESAQQAFQDLAAHQLALIAGLEAAVSALLQRFAPDALEERIGKVTMLEGVLPQVRRARLWEAFETEYQHIAQQAAEDFQEILGQHFARAYIEQIQRLENAGFGGKGTENAQS